MKQLTFTLFALLISFASFAVLPVTGTMSLCVGATTHLSDATPSGTWSSVNTVVAAIGSTGIVTGITAGTSTISYTVGGVAATTVVTVNITPVSITGTPHVCLGLTTVLSDGTTGGTWTSSDTTVASVGSSSGIVTGIVSTTAIISYSLGTGCMATQTITVNPLPSVTGVSIMCIADSTTLTGIGGTGTWISANTAVAIVGSSSGNVTGITAGNATITFTLSATGCNSTVTATVNPLPATITGVSSVCVGGTQCLSDAIGGGSWYSQNPAIASVTLIGGCVSGIAAGVDSVTYTLATGCYTALTVTVNTTPSLITGPTGVCLGSTATLSDPSTGGTWSSSNTSVATIGSGTSVVAGITAGSATITYKFPTTGCYTTQNVTINSLPVPISGPTSICVGGTTIISDGTSGGTWKSSNTSVATIALFSGVVSGIALGTTTITYLVFSTGCITTETLTVTSAPGLITGATSICVGLTSSLSNTVTGGTWSSSSTSTATVGITSGVVTGVSAGSCNITYSIGTGCKTVIMVTITPAPLGISGFSTLCIGIATTLSDPTGGGTWSSNNTSVASIGSGSGIVTGLSVGSTIVSYTTGSCSATKVIGVDVTPGPILGPSVVCVGDTIYLSDVYTGGSWTTSATLSLIVPPGLGIGISPGTSTVTYSLGSGCIVTKTITISATPSPLSGPTAVCIGSTITISDALGGGTWSSSNTSVATISGFGVATGLSIGTSIISYKTTGSCSTSETITVSPTPGPINGPSSLCDGATTTLSNLIGGGTWTSSSTTIAVIGFYSPVVFGLISGTTTISYSLGAGCMVTRIETVSPLPVFIIGPVSVCVGQVIAISDATPGGIWTSSNTIVAAIGSVSGIVIGISVGTSTISYTLGGGCGVSTAFNIMPLPLAITGPSSVCRVSTITLSDATSGGIWSSSNTAIARTGSAGLVTGVSSGTATISYILGTGCAVFSSVTVNPVATPAVAMTVSPNDTVCTGTTVSYSVVSLYGGPMPVYAWFVNRTFTGATSTTYSYVPLNNDTVTAMMASDYTCRTSDTAHADIVMTVYPVPAISGPSDVCSGSTSTLTAGGLTGTWSSSNTAIATISTIGGFSSVVTGISTGTFVITFTSISGCVGTYSMTDNPLPVITSSSSYGCGAVYTLTSGGGVSYSWAPSTGLSCSTCGTTTINPAATTAFTVTGTDVNGCTNTSTTTVNGDRINGFITFGGPKPDTLDMKVWLIQFDPTDSSISALDSTLTCVVDSIGYFEFDSKPSGNYMAKAKLLYGNTPGSSGYVPTYSLSTPNWYAAATVAHTGGSDSLHMNMVYGTVPVGPGFISGYVYSGAGKGSSADIPVPGMLVQLQDNTNKTLTYTYTDATGYYSFSGLGYDDFIIFPEDYDYNTTAAPVISLNSSNVSVTAVDFKQYLNARTIVPYVGSNLVHTVTNTVSIGVYPNPTSGALNIKWENQSTGSANVIITDVLGREVFSSVLNINTASGQSPINVEELKDGVYQISIQSGSIYYSGKLVVQQ